MKIKVLTFGITKDIIGQHEMWLELQTGTTVKETRMGLEKEHPALADLASLFVAVNEEYAEDDQALNDGDVLALIPPVSGG